MQQSPLESRKFDCVLYNIFDQKLDSSGLCCIATEKIWWLLTKFIINNHLTVEEKICHRK
ncbi:hypothetical protein ACJZL1_03915 [Wolbachia endosymbiont of Rhagoletis indifferens]|uniref:hypothetical protein n=1 Tax=Wolbachia endosymbiont of Rhagoletis indifferens TaxID=3383250 RepID=UPI003AF3FCF1